MTSKRSHEGYLIVDHRESPGVPDVMAHRTGLPAGAGRGVFETSTFTCSHCCRVVILTPLRQRDPAWCSSCDRYLCTVCGTLLAQTGECRNMQRIAEEVQEAAARGATAAELNRIITP